MFDYGGEWCSRASFAQSTVALFEQWPWWRLGYTILQQVSHASMFLSTAYHILYTPQSRTVYTLQPYP